MTIGRPPADSPATHVAAGLHLGCAAPAGLQAEWEALFATGYHEPSTSFEWTAALSRSHASHGDQLSLLTLVRDGDLVGLVPVALRRSKVLGWSVSTLTPVSEWYGTHSAVLLREVSRPVVSTMIDGLLAAGFQWDVFRMARLIDGDPLLGELEECLASQRWPFDARYTEASYVLTLPNTFDAYLRDRSAKFRSHLKRTTRRIEQLDGRVVGLEAVDFATAYEMLLTVERRSWKHAQGTAISAVSRQSQFYREMGAAAADRGRLHLQFLVVNEEPVAYNYGYIVAGTYSYLKTSYDERFKPFGVATYLRARLVEELIHRGIHRLDFPAEPYEWESQWTDTMRWHKAVVVYNSTLTGQALHRIDRLRRRQAAGPPALAHRDPRALKGRAY